MILRLFYTTLIAFSLAACAKNADRVLPVSVPSLEYERMSCADLATARLHVLEAVNALSLSQERAASNDAFGVMLLGLPVASMSGADREAELAVAKGRDLAIQSAQSAKRCSV
jgi:hypothetical protein